MDEENKLSSLNNKRDELFSKKIKLEVEYNTFLKSNEYIQDYVNTRSSNIKKKLDNPMVISDPNLLNFYIQKGERLKSFSESENDFKSNMHKLLEQYNEEIDLELKLLESEIDSINKAETTSPEEA